MFDLFFLLKKTTFLVTILIFSINVLAFNSGMEYSASSFNHPPYEYVEGNKPVGIAVDIIKEAVKRTGNFVDFIFLPWDKAAHNVELGINDILFNTDKNEMREAWGYYSNSTLLVKNYVLFKRKRTKLVIYSNYNNTKNVSIAIRSEDQYGDGEFRYALDNNKFENIIYSDNTYQSVDLLLNRFVDVFVGDYLSIMYYLSENNLLHEIDVVKEYDVNENHVVLNVPSYVLFSKKSVTKEFVELFDNAMDEIKIDGTHNKILLNHERNIIDKFILYN